MAKKNQLDKYPNYMTGTVTQAVADTNIASQFSTPIPRLQTRGGKATVMELLWIDFSIGTTLNAVNESVNVSFYGGTTTTSPVKVSNPRGIAFVAWDGDMLVTSGPVKIGDASRYNLQSQDGFGFLFAGDAINVTLGSANTGITNSVDWRIYYRFVDIPITEFVGLVQSQQQSSS